MFDNGGQARAKRQIPNEQNNQNNPAAPNQFDEKINNQQNPNSGGVTQVGSGTGVNPPNNNGGNALNNGNSASNIVKKDGSNLNSIPNSANGQQAGVNMNRGATNGVGN